VPRRSPTARGKAAAGRVSGGGGPLPSRTLVKRLRISTATSLGHKESAHGFNSGGVRPVPEGTGQELRVDGIDYLIMKEDDVLAIQERGV